MHYISYQNNLLDHMKPDYAEKFEHFTQLQDKWRLHFEDHYADHKSDLSGDINF